MRRIGVSLPGGVDLASHRLVFAPNLGGRAFDLKRPLEAGTGLPVELENDANARALAELWFGQYPKGVRNLVADTVSEGIGRFRWFFKSTLALLLSLEPKYDGCGPSLVAGSNECAVV